MHHMQYTTTWRVILGEWFTWDWVYIHCRSIKQKLNTKSSTEAELDGTSDYVPYNICYVLFMRHQFQQVFLENQRTMRMEVNRRNSCTGNSYHIDIIYIFYQGSGGKGGTKYSVLSNTYYVSWLFHKYIRLGPSQYLHFFYTRSHLSGL